VLLPCSGVLNLMQLAAHRLDGDHVNDYDQWYGPTTVAKHAVSLAVESGEYGQAVFPGGVGTRRWRLSQAYAYILPVRGGKRPGA